MNTLCASSSLAQDYMHKSQCHTIYSGLDNGTDNGYNGTDNYHMILP